jgi:hypothetical protein
VEHIKPGHFATQLATGLNAALQLATRLNAALQFATRLNAALQFVGHDCAACQTHIVHSFLKESTAPKDGAFIS